MNLNQRRAVTCLLITGLTFSNGNPVAACGFWFPRQYLGGGGSALFKTPEFFAEIELKLLAREFPTPFKAARETYPQHRNAEQDILDFDAAIRERSVTPPAADAARAAHRGMREALSELVDPSADAEAPLAKSLDRLQAAEFPSEFSDYHEGALAYARSDHAKARAVWERLLARPENERRHRSVNAAFMIGVLACVDDLDETPKWLALVRDLALKGFHDSSGLAAASYAWEARWLTQRGNLRQAAESRLRAVASGYPARTCVEPANDSPEELAKFAADPLLRRIHTALLLGEFTSLWRGDEDGDKAFNEWLTAIEAAKISDFAGAERVGWMCYRKGDYAAAKRWLTRAPAESPEALWLEGKLAARDGRGEDSMRALSRAAQLLAMRKEPLLEITERTPDSDTTESFLSGERGIVALSAAEFQNALEAFLGGDHWVDAAHVAERLLTVEQLMSFVRKRSWRAEWDTLSPEQLDQLDKPADGELTDEKISERLDVVRVQSANLRTRQLRWLLARRLARVGRFKEARPFFPAKQRAELNVYVRGITPGSNGIISREARALALWQSALEARYHGLELFGTEAAPDWFVHDGSYEEDDPAAIRTGHESPEPDGPRKAESLPALLQAGSVERARLKLSEIKPNKRFHYRYRAADLAWNAARLLPSDDRRLAEMLDLAGRWLAGRDDQSADRFYQALESRCAQTEIGRRAQARHWFVDIEEYSIPTRPNELNSTD